MSVLICLQHAEPYIHEICAFIKAKGVTPIIFEHDNADHTFVCEYASDGVNGLLKIAGKTYCLNKETFPSIWHRIKPITLCEIPGERGKLKEQLNSNEWRHILASFEVFLGESKWINNLAHKQKACFKAYQLSLAAEVGLPIPETVVQKDYALRVAVVGNHVFTMRMDTQKRPKSCTEWHHYAMADICAVGELSAITTKKLLAFHHRARLVYAIYDFMVDKDGCELFLECNPAGEWWWFDKIFGFSITEAIAHELLSVQ